jgi:hypothetical protein
MEDTVRWSLKVSRETDEALRAYLGRSGARKGDLSRFVQQAVRDRLRTATAPAPATRSGGGRMDLAQALGEIRSQTRKLSQRQFEKLVTEAVAYARRR